MGSENEMVLGQFARPVACECKEMLQGTWRTDKGVTETYSFVPIGLKKVIVVEVVDK